MLFVFQVKAKAAAKGNPTTKASKPTVTQNHPPASAQPLSSAPTFAMAAMMSAGRVKPTVVRMAKPLPEFKENTFNEEPKKEETSLNQDANIEAPPLLPRDPVPEDNAVPTIVVINEVTKHGLPDQVNHNPRPHSLHEELEEDPILEANISEHPDIKKSRENLALDQDEGVLEITEEGDDHVDYTEENEDSQPLIT